MLTRKLYTPARMARLFFNGFIFTDTNGIEVLEEKTVVDVFAVLTGFRSEPLLQELEQNFACFGV